MPNAGPLDAPDIQSRLQAALDQGLAALENTTDGEYLVALLCFRNAWVLLGYGQFPATLMEMATGHCWQERGISRALEALPLRQHKALIPNAALAIPEGSAGA